ncbi:MAG: HAMP domain-containing histidine kinase [Elusimicrobia bacterium]|nr:HAMP domain-containing histidine kinase [Elusimicrobiota bacterium]
MSIKSKFTIFISLLILIIIVGITTILYYAERKLLDEQMENHRKSLVAGLVQIGRESLLVGDDLILINYANLLKKTNPSIMDVIVTDKKGIIIAHTDSNLLKKQINAEPDTDKVKVESPVVFGTDEVAKCIINFSKVELEKIFEKGLKKTKQRVFTIGVASLIIGFFGAWLFSYLMTAPIELLSKGAKIVGSGNLEHKVRINRRDELGALADHFNMMTEKLKELDEMKRDFVSSLTHELRSPLGAIETYINLLLDKNPEYEKENFFRIKKNVSRLRNFINDLLDIAKIEKGKMEISPVPFDLSDAVKDIVDLFKLQAGEKKIDLAYSSDLSIINIKADEDHIKQVITNLVSNALKFTPAGGKICINAKLVQSKKTADYILVSVSDTGIGIPKDSLDKLFQKFEQVKGVREKIKGPKGTGLGLSIAKGIVELHGGKIWIESDINKGTTFFFTIPV